MNPHEAKRLCDQSLKRSRARRDQAKVWRDTNRELFAILLAILVLTATLAIASALKGYGVW